MRIPGIFLVCALALPVAADEGMWLFNQFPKEQVKKTYTFDVTDQFLENLRLGSLRIGSNAGSLVSANGLILTDRSAVADCVAKLNAAYVKDGFYAATQANELPCSGLEASVPLDPVMPALMASCWSCSTDLIPATNRPSF